MTIHIWISTEQDRQVEEDMLDDSIRNRTEADYMIHWMRRGEDQFQNWMCDRLFKWAVPELMGYDGFAIILSDVCSYVQGDITELYQYGTTGQWLTAVNGKVAVVDCSGFTNQIPQIKILRKMPKDLDFELTKIVKPQPVIPFEWNADEEFANRSSKLLRYSDVKKFQPTKGLGA